MTPLSGEIEGTPISVNVPPPGASAPIVTISTNGPSDAPAQIVEVTSAAVATLWGSGPARVSEIACAAGDLEQRIATARTTAYRYRREQITEIMRNSLMRATAREQCRMLKVSDEPYRTVRTRLRQIAANPA